MKFSSVKIDVFWLCIWPLCVYSLAFVNFLNSLECIEKIFYLPVHLIFQEKLYQWIWRQEEGGSRVTTVDVLNYIQVCS